MKFETNQSVKTKHLLDSVSSDDESDFKIIKDEHEHPVQYEVIEHQQHMNMKPESNAPYLSRPGFLLKLQASCNRNLSETEINYCILMKSEIDIS